MSQRLAWGSPTIDYPKQGVRTNIRIFAMWENRYGSGESQPYKVYLVDNFSNTTIEMEQGAVGDNSPKPYIAFNVLMPHTPVVHLMINAMDSSGEFWAPSLEGDFTLYP
jgi:hypothetical protein